MKTGNVLVLGNSGCGKSTLINAVLGEEVAKTGWGSKGTTEQLEIYEKEDINFCIIDSLGFEPSKIRKNKAVREVKKWSKQSAKEGKEDTQINVIWFCVEGTSSKLFPETIKDLVKATKIYKSIPIIVVITKSYSSLERKRNISMVQQAFMSNKKALKKLKAIIPVVAKPYSINESIIVPPEGIEELIQVTNDLMPEGIKAGKQDIGHYILNQKRVLSQTVVVTGITTGVVIAAVPIPFADALILQPVEVALVKAIAKIYGIKNNEKTQKLFTTMIEIGTVGAVAKTAISGLKAIPGINITTSIMNGAVAGTIIASLGESSAYVFEQIYLGKHGIEDVEWVKAVLESKTTVKLVNKVNDKINGITSDIKPEDLVKMLTDIIKKS